MIEHDIEMFYIELIEDFPCESVEQLRKREGELTRLYGTLSIRIEDRSNKERDTLWNTEHREQKKQRIRKSKVKHKDDILVGRREQRLGNIEEVREHDREWYQANIEKIQAQAKAWK